VQITKVFPIHFERGPATCRSPRQKKKLHRWRISRIRATPTEFIGYVEAPDETEAIKNAVREYRITNPEKQKRLVAQGVK
jgi:hypothetical protein